MQQQLNKYYNILNRNFTTKPNQKWVTDISYIHTNQGVLYLSMIMDLYANTIRAAKDKEKVTIGLQLHSDQGFQYTFKGYFDLTKEYDITPSMSSRGNCYDNACAENFFGILKSECIYRTKPKHFQEARLLLDDYIYFYNYERIQLKAKLTPYEKWCQLT